MGRRGTVPLEAVTEWNSGDVARAPQGAALKLKNVFSRPGRLEKRHPWNYENPGSTPRRLMYHVSSTGDTHTLCFSAENVNGEYRNGSGTWTIFTDAGTGQFGDGDFCNLNGKMYGVGSLLAFTGTFSFSFDGTTDNDTPFVTGLGGRSCESFLRRVFIGGPVIRNGQVNTAIYAFENAAEWTLTGATCAVAGNIRTITLNNTTDTIISKTYTNGAAESYVTWQQQIRAASATVNIPLTMRITNAAGTTVYATKEFTLPTTAEEPDWVDYGIQARIPALGTYRLELRAGTVPVPTFTVPTTMDVSYRAGIASDDNRGPMLSYGRFYFDKTSRLYGLVAPTPVEEFPYRLIWCETDDVTFWRASNFIDLLDAPGDITAVRAAKNMMVAYKNRGIWLFRGNADPDVPLVRQGFIKEVGCVGPKAISVYNDKHYFIGANEVWEYEPGGQPQPLCGEAKRETLFAASTLVSDPVLAIDTDNKEVWVCIRTGLIDVFNLETRRWTHINITGAAGADVQVRDLCYVQVSGDTKRRMWALNTTNANVLKIDDSQTQDKVDSLTTQDVVAEVVFRPIESGSPRNDVTVETLNIRHKITGDQTGSTTRFEISRNDGTSFDNYNDVTLGPVSTGGVEELGLPVLHTAGRITLGVRHTGLAGPTYFNLYHGTTADVIVNGPEPTATLAAAVGSDL